MARISGKTNQNAELDSRKVYELFENIDNHRYLRV